ncbi:MAG: HEPN domain-containing protein [Lachnospiraceae bacterium]|nr:HEPN domain-containing protein [Lachnospiraceae bacterium]
MESRIKELAKYRMERAREMLSASEDNLKADQVRTSLNRSYYAVFHAMRAVNCLEGFDSSKHSGVISFFTKNFLKEERLDRSLSQIIKDTSFLREKADYDDFYVASRAEAERQLKNAQVFVEKVSRYLEERPQEENGKSVI